MEHSYSEYTEDTIDIGLDDKLRYSIEAAKASKQARAILFNRRKTQHDRRIDDTANNKAMLRELGEAGKVSTMDDRAARYGVATSTFNELPHRLKQFKAPLSSPEHVEVLVRERDALKLELVYMKECRDADKKFLFTMLKLKKSIDEALESRLNARKSASEDYLRIWGISFGDGELDHVCY